MSKMLEVAQKAMEAVDAGENVFDYLEKAGYKNPSSTWYMLKQHAKKHDPDLYERMAAVAVGRRKPNPAPAKAKPVETPVISPEEAETVFFGGKEYEKLEGEGKPVNEYREKPSPTCCQPAKPSGVTVPDELSVCAVKSGFRKDAKYELCGVKDVNECFMAFIWRDLINHSEQELAMSASQWRKFVDEIPKALTQLGM